MAKTSEHLLCEQFVNNRLNDIKLQLDQCSTELKAQFHSCPITLLPLKTILDENLKQFVEIQLKYLSNKMNNRLIGYQGVIQEKQLFEILSTFSVTSDQVKC